MGQILGVIEIGANTGKGRGRMGGMEKWKINGI